MRYSLSKQVHAGFQTSGTTCEVYNLTIRRTVRAAFYIRFASVASPNTLLVYQSGEQAVRDTVTGNSWQAGRLVVRKDVAVRPGGQGRQLADGIFILASQQHRP